MTAHRETDQTLLRQHLLRRIERAPLEHLQTLAAYFEVADAPQQLATQAAQTDQQEAPPVPASLVWPSDEVLREELETRAANRSTVGWDEMVTIMRERFA